MQYIIKMMVFLGVTGFCISVSTVKADTGGSDLNDTKQVSQEKKKEGSTEKKQDQEPKGTSSNLYGEGASNGFSSGKEFKPSKIPTITVDPCLSTPYKTSPISQKEKYDSRVPLYPVNDERNSNVGDSPERVTSKLNHLNKHHEEIRNIYDQAVKGKVVNSSVSIGESYICILEEHGLVDPLLNTTNWNEGPPGFHVADINYKNVHFFVYEGKVHSITSIIEKNRISLSEVLEELNEPTKRDGGLLFYSLRDKGLLFCFNEDQLLVDYRVSSRKKVVE